MEDGRGQAGAHGEWAYQGRIRAHGRGGWFALFSGLVCSFVGLVAALLGSWVWVGVYIGMAICPYMSYIARIPILNYIPIYSVVTRARAREQPTTDTSKWTVQRYGLL